jgi:hypothetical protein
MNLKLDGQSTAYQGKDIFSFANGDNYSLIAELEDKSNIRIYPASHPATAFKGKPVTVATVTVYREEGFVGTSEAINKVIEYFANPMIKDILLYEIGIVRTKLTTYHNQEDYDNYLLQDDEVQEYTEIYIRGFWERMILEDKIIDETKLNPTSTGRGYEFDDDIPF